MAPPASAPLLARAAQSLKAGRPLDAIAALREAARLRPDDAAILHDLGVACLEHGLLAEAVVALQQALARKPRFARAQLRLGMAFEAVGDAAAAIAAYRHAATLQPSLTEAQFRAANLLDVTGQDADAIAMFRRAAASGPKTGLGRLAAARALLGAARDAEAERVLRQALALDASNAMALDLLGTVLADAGRFDEARDCFARAIAQAPLLAGSFYDLVRCRPITPDDAPLVARITATLADPRLDAGQKLRVHLALGKAADDLGDPAQAMRQFAAADAIRRAIAPFDADAFDAQIDRLIATVTPDLIARAKAGASDATTPVLIMGLPRSGTTLVEQILSSHGEVTAGGELPFWNTRGAHLPHAGAAPLADAAADYLRLLRTISPDAARVTDKMPMNFLRAGLIHAALPSATIIHCRRRAIDTALSIHRTYFNPRLALPTGGAELVRYVRACQRLAGHWRRVLPPDRFIEVEYDALTATPEPVIRRMVASCGLGWDDSCLHPERNQRVIRTPSKWQARQPIYRADCDGWRRYDPWLGPLRALIDE